MGKLKRQSMYDATGDDYETNRYGAPHMSAYRSMRNETLSEIIATAFGTNVPLRILEVGCGTGLSLEYLSRQPVGHSLVGVDFSRTMLRQAHEKARRLERSPTLVLGDASRLSFENDVFDVVYSTRFIHQFSHEVKQRIHGELMRVTRRGGIVISEFYGRNYHRFRYYLQGSKQPKEVFLTHYPAASEVREIVGGSVERLPVRVAGARLLRRVLGDGALSWVTKMAKHPPISILTDEYFVIARK